MTAPSSEQPTAPEFGSTERRDEAKASTTATVVTEPPSPSWRGRLDRRSGSHGRVAEPKPPLPGANVARVALAAGLAALCVLTVGGAVLMLLLWQQQRASGVLSSQLERTWELFDLLRVVERFVALGLVPVAAIWAAFAAINVRRATGRRRSPIFAAGSVVVGVAGAWYIGHRVVDTSTDWLGQGAGFVLQAIALAVPLLALERIAVIAEARHGPLRATYLIAVVLLAHLQFLGGLSTVDQSSGPDEWGLVGAYLVICALLQILGSLSANEAARAIEDGTRHRYELRSRFGESVMMQAMR